MKLAEKLSSQKNFTSSEKQVACYSYTDTHQQSFENIYTNGTANNHSCSGDYCYMSVNHDQISRGCLTVLDDSMADVKMKVNYNKSKIINNICRMGSMNLSIFISTCAPRAIAIWRTYHSLKYFLAHFSSYFFTIIGTLCRASHSCFIQEAPPPIAITTTTYFGTTAIVTVAVETTTVTVTTSSSVVEATTKSSYSSFVTLFVFVPSLCLMFMWNKRISMNRCTLARNLHHMIHWEKADVCPNRNVKTEAFSSVLLYVDFHSLSSIRSHTYMQ